jgi:uncharacterized protein YaiE (UPF0345 family)
MLPGEYEFNTEAKEIMEILSCELDVFLPQKMTGNHSRVEIHSKCLPIQNSI